MSLDNWLESALTLESAFRKVLANLWSVEHTAPAACISVTVDAVIDRGSIMSDYYQGRIQKYFDIKSNQLFNWKEEENVTFSYKALGFMVAWMPPTLPQCAIVLTQFPCGCTCSNCAHCVFQGIWIGVCLACSVMNY